MRKIPLNSGRYKGLQFFTECPQDAHVVMDLALLYCSVIVQKMVEFGAVKTHSNYI